MKSKITFSLDDYIVEMIDNYATLMGMSRSAVLNQLLTTIYPSMIDLINQISPVFENPNAYSEEDLKQMKEGVIARMIAEADGE